MSHSKEHVDIKDCGASSKNRDMTDRLLGEVWFSLGFFSWPWLLASQQQQEYDRGNTTGYNRILRPSQCCRNLSKIEANDISGLMKPFCVIARFSSIINHHWKSEAAILTGSHFYSAGLPFDVSNVADLPFSTRSLQHRFMPSFWKSVFWWHQNGRCDTTSWFGRHRNGWTQVHHPRQGGEGARWYPAPRLSEVFRWLWHAIAILLGSFRIWAS